ncbi:mitochondrial import inner membrane translocase [Striga asiatica]|uniref:Mitochondrial import inner membrane translocase n=1 Tax=Striga asiatica TaxID=4170 RepID=A0A5A7QH76_STRAF|nr:mitochondrial import inner membrane translocase [Striga asiatica]
MGCKDVNKNDNFGAEYNFFFLFRHAYPKPSCCADDSCSFNGYLAFSPTYLISHLKPTNLFQILSGLRDTTGKKSQRRSLNRHIISKAPLMSSNPDNEQNASSSTQEAPTPQIEPIRLPTVEEIRGQDIWNNCAVRSVVSGVMGGGLGLFMGLFLGALDNPLMQDEMTGRQQLIYQAKQMGRRSWSSCKAFAVMGFVFSASECVVEKARAKHDITNTVVAGCVTGGAISARGGPKAACAGCAGFAAFSVVIEKFLERHT